MIDNTNDVGHSLAVVRERALDVLGTPQDVERWLISPNFPLGDVPPIDLLVTEQGLQQVLGELIAIEHGLPV